MDRGTLGAVTKGLHRVSKISGNLVESAGALVRAAELNVRMAMFNIHSDERDFVRAALQIGRARSSAEAGIDLLAAAGKGTFARAERNALLETYAGLDQLARAESVFTVATVRNVTPEEAAGGLDDVYRSLAKAEKSFLDSNETLGNHLLNWSPPPAQRP